MILARKTVPASVVPSPARLRALLLATGAASLIYETVAFAMARRWLGASGYAAAAVLAVFMCGLALGGMLGGALADRPGSPRRKLGLLLLAAAAVTALTPLGFRIAAPPATWLYRYLDGGSQFLTSLRVALAFAVLLPGSVAFGAVLPCAVKSVGGANTPAGRAAGIGYTWVTLGGALGAGLGGFVLLPLGSVWALTTACVLAVGAALAVLSAPRTAPPPRLAVENTEPLNSSYQPTAPRGDQLKTIVSASVLTPYALLGSVLMLYEVAWFRLLGVQFGASAYAFAMLLAVVIVGLGLGAALGGRFATRTRRPLLVLAVAHAAAGAYMLLSLASLDYLPERLNAAYELAGHRFWAAQVVQWAIASIMIVPVTLSLGMGLPLVCAARARNDRLGRDVGRLSAAGSLGAAAGALLAGMWLVPRFGIVMLMRTGIVTAVGASAFLAIWHAPSPVSALSITIRRGLRQRALLPLTLAVAVSAGALLWPPPDIPPLASSSFVAWRRAARGGTMPGGILRYHADGVSSAVSVRESTDGERVILLDGKPDASSHGDLANQSLIAHVPLMLHANPRKALVIGLASGISAGSALRHPGIEQVDCCEIEPAMLPASRLFSDVNNAVLEDHRFRLWLIDGRLHVSAMRAHYDVIISEPSNPWVAGMADLFTVEFFRLAARALRPAGVFAAWVETYDLSRRDFERVVHTFRTVFPHVQVWCPQPGDVLLIGSLAPFSVSADDWLERIEHRPLFRDLARIGIHALPDLLSNFVAAGEDVAGLTPDGTALLRDRGPTLEYSAPRALFRPDNLEDGVALLEASRSGSARWLRQGSLDSETYNLLMTKIERRMEARAEAMRAIVGAGRTGDDRHAQSLRRAYALNPRDTVLQRVLRDAERAAAQHLAAGAPAEASRSYRALLKIAPEHAPAHYGLGFSLVAEGQTPQTAIRHLREATRLEPDNLSYRLALAETLWRAGLAVEALGAYRAAHRLSPDDPPVLNNLAWVLADVPPPLRNLEEALLMATRACNLTDWRHPHFLRTLHRIQRLAGLEHEARETAVRLEALDRQSNDG